MPTRILIADDNHAVRAALRHLLEGAGVDQWEIVEAEDGQDTIGKAQELSPSLIILDLVMPGMDGLAAARKLSKSLPDIPLLMHTLHYSPQLEVEAQKVGVRKVVPKADTTGLLSAIRQFLTPEPSALIPAVAENIPSIAAASVAALPPVLDPEKASTSDAHASERPGDIPVPRPPT
jgi:two-component system response regulator DesR